jgi:hypothetical protein
VSDLLDLEADLFRLGKDSPAVELDGRWRGLWRVAAEWVRELRSWRFPHAAMPVDDIEDSLLRRKLAEERFNTTLADPADADASVAVVCTV